MTLSEPFLSNLKTHEMGQSTDGHMVGRKTLDEPNSMDFLSSRWT